MHEFLKFSPKMIHKKSNHPPTKHLPDTFREEHEGDVIGKVAEHSEITPTRTK